MWRTPNKSSNGSVKFEVLSTKTEGVLGVRVYCAPQYRMKEIKEVLTEAFSTLVTHRNDIFLGYESYRDALRVLAPKCAAAGLVLERIPAPLETWFDGYAGRAAEKSECVWEKTPPKIRSAVFPYQREGIEAAVARNGRLLFADDMGLGKSLQSIAAMAYYATSDSKQLIVCPSYLRYNWRREITTWTGASDEDVCVVMKTKQPIPESARTVVISYDLAVRKLADLQRRRWTTVILDESHYIKNRKAKRTKALTSILKKVPHLMLLTGTPALSRPEELYAQLHVLFPKVFPSFNSFAFRYCAFKKTMWGWDSSGSSNADELNVVLRDIMVRRLKKNVLKQLPSKMREELTVVLRPKELKEMKPLFDHLQELNEDLRRVSEPTDEDRSKIFERSSLVSELFRKTCAAKIPAVCEYVEQLVESTTHQTILFAHHHIMLDALEEVCQKKDVAYVRIDGKTPQAQRQDLVDQFRGDPSIRVAILGLHACSTGLNFTPIRYMVFCETSWNPASLLQAEDRIHRIGASGESVFYTYICAKDTLDERVYTKLARKHALMDRIIDSGENADGFDRVISSTFERAELDPEPPQDLARFGIHTPLLLGVRIPDGLLDMETFLETYCIEFERDFYNDHLRDNLLPDPEVSAPNPNSRYVNLNELGTESAAQEVLKRVFILTDLSLLDIIATQRMESLESFDVMCGMHVALSGPSVLLHIGERDGRRKRKK
jgi:SWI/SNF-related matrix-associated actin-dependent regulator 1 of chromatin subfamily A